VRYLSRLGDEVENRAVFEGYELDEIQAADARIRPDDPDLLRDTRGLQPASCSMFSVSKAAATPRMRARRSRA
jgi:hypothetical protein